MDSLYSKLERKVARIMNELRNDGSRGSASELVTEWSDDWTPMPSNSICSDQHKITTRMIIMNGKDCINTEPKNLGRHDALGERPYCGRTLA